MVLYAGAIWAVYYYLDVYGLIPASFTAKTVGFNWIWTRIDGVEVERADHWTKIWSKMKDRTFKLRCKWIQCKFLYNIRTPKSTLCVIKCLIPFQYFSCCTLFNTFIQIISFIFLFFVPTTSDSMASLEIISKRHWLDPQLSWQQLLVCYFLHEGSLIIFTLVDAVIPQTTRNLPTTIHILGSGCSSGGRAFASESIGP